MSPFVAYMIFFPAFLNTLCIVFMFLTLYYVKCFGGDIAYFIWFAVLFVITLALFFWILPFAIKTHKEETK